MPPVGGAQYQKEPAVSHELEHARSAIYAGNLAAWHRLGIVKPDAALTTEQIYAEIPELGSTISTSPLFAMAGSDVVTSPRWVAHVRDYDGKMVGVTGPNYSVVQPRAAFEFAEELIQQGGAVWDTAMTLRDGSVNIGCLKLPGDIIIAGIESERHTPYLMVANSFDGSMAFTLTISWVRAVCMNTVNWSISSAMRRLVLRHTASIEGRLQEAREALALTYKFGAELDALAQQLLAIPVTTGIAERVVGKLIPTPKPKDADDDGANIKLRTERAQQKRDAIISNWKTADNLDAIRPTGWGLLNAITEWEQHLAHPNRKADVQVEKVLADSQLATTATGLILATA